VVILEITAPGVKSKVRSLKTWCRQDFNRTSAPQASVPRVNPKGNVYARRLPSGWSALKGLKIDNHADRGEGC